jgi:hypothetical protein
MPLNQIKYDDPSGFGFVRPVQSGRTVVSYPFIQNGDRGTVVYSRTFYQLESAYKPIAPGTERDSVWVGGDPNAYNLPDSPPEHTGIGDLMRFTRSYARIPPTQTTYPGSQYIQLPVVANNYGTESSIAVFDYSTGTDAGSGYFNKNGGAIYTEYQQALYGPTKAPTGARVPGKATAGTFTLTYGANTTAALNWNDADATINAAVNALASVTAAGLTFSINNALSTVTGGGLVIAITVGSTLSALTLNGGSLTVSTSNHPTTQINSSTSQDILLADHITVSSHGLNTGLTLAAVYARTTPIIITMATGSWGSVDANTLWLPTGSTYGDVVFVGTYSRAFQAGKSCLLRTKVVETFALPGISVGITTASDIATDFGLQNAEDFISAMVNQTGFQTYSVDGPAFWMGGPIYRLETLKINLDDIS